MIGGDRLAVPQDFARGLKKTPPDRICLGRAPAQGPRSTDRAGIPRFLPLFLHHGRCALRLQIWRQVASADMVREIRNASRYRPGFDPRKSVFDTVSGYCSNAECSLGDKPRIQVQSQARQTVIHVFRDGGGVCCLLA